MKVRHQEPLGPLIHDDDYVIPLLSRVLDLREKLVITSPDKVGLFRVFSCHPENKANKRPRRIQKRIQSRSDDNGTPAIVLSSAASAVMLQVSDVTSHDQRKRLYLGVKPYTGSLHTLRYHGHVEEKGVILIFLALKLLDRLSFLFRFPSQGHQFVPKYLTLLGLGHYSYFDDCERVLLIAEGEGAAEIFLNLYEKQKDSDSVRTTFPENMRNRVYDFNFTYTIDASSIVENLQTGYTLTSSSSMPTLCSTVPPRQQTGNINNNITISTIQPLTTIPLNANVRPIVNTYISINPAGDATQEQSTVSPQGSGYIPIPSLPFRISTGACQQENIDTTNTNEPCSSAPENKERGKRGKAKTKTKAAQRKKKENQETTAAQIAEILAFLDYNYLGRSDEENLVCYICSDRFDERVQLKNHIVNLHLRHIPIKAFSVCPLCALVCRSRNQFVDHALKSARKANACKALLLRSREKQIPKSKQQDNSE